MAYWSWILITISARAIPMTSRRARRWPLPRPSRLSLSRWREVYWRSPESSSAGDELGAERFPDKHLSKKEKAHMGNQIQKKSAVVAVLLFNLACSRSSTYYLE